MRISIVVGALIAAGVLVGAAGAQEPPTEADAPKLVRVIPQDRIPAIFRPTYVEAASANLADDTPVIGLTINGEARAFALSLLDAHEIVNDTIGGTPVAVTW